MLIKRTKPLWKGMVDGREYVASTTVIHDDIIACAKRGESVTWELRDDRKMTLSPSQILNDSKETIGPFQSRFKDCPDYILRCYTFIEDEDIDSN